MNIWERALDLVALGFIAGVAALLRVRSPASADRGWASRDDGGVVSAVPVIPARLLKLWSRARRRSRARSSRTAVLMLERLASGKAWFTALVASVAAWLLPGARLWLLAGEWQPAVGRAVG